MWRNLIMKKKITFNDLYKLIENRIESGEIGSYTNTLINKGSEFIERKVLEETLEVILESHDNNREGFIDELSDLIYHLLVLSAAKGVHIDSIEECLGLRHKGLSTYYERIIEKLDKYKNEQIQITFDEIVNTLNYKNFKKNDILLFSHNFWKNNSINISNTNRFTYEAKELKNLFSSQEIKTQFAIKTEQEIEIYERRSDEIIIPLIFVLNYLCLPMTLNILAGYIKDQIDKKLSKKNDGREKIDINIGYRKSPDAEEEWIRIIGTAEDVQRILESL